MSYLYGSIFSHFLGPSCLHTTFPEYPLPAANFFHFAENDGRIVDAEVDAVDFEPEEEDLMDDDTAMDGGNIVAYWIDGHS